MEDVSPRRTLSTAANRGAACDCACCPTATAETPLPATWLQGAEPTAEVLHGGVHWLACQPIELCPAVTAWRARWYGADVTETEVDLLRAVRERTCIAAPIVRYCDGQPLRVWRGAMPSTTTTVAGSTPTAEADAYEVNVAAANGTGNDDNRKIDSGWRAATPAETSTAIMRCCAAHCTAALLAPAALATEHTRYARFVQDRYGVLVDAFSGATLDLMTQSATLQYKTETERRELLGATAGADMDFEHVADAVLERQRKGSAVAEIRTGGIDGSQLLQDLLHAGVGWEQGCYTGQPCALVLGPAASGKTTMLRRFAVEAVQLPGHFVPIFVTVIDLVRWAADACRSDDVPTRALELFEATIAQAAAAPPAAPLRARFLAQALAERRVLFLVDGMDEAGEQAELVETMLARHVAGGGHRLIATTRRSGLSDGLRRNFAGAQHRVVQLLPLDAAQQREMVARGLARRRSRRFDGGARPAAGGAGAEPAHAHDDALRLQAAGRELAREPQRAVPRCAARHARARRHGVQGRSRRAGARAMPAARGIRFARAAAG